MAFDPINYNIDTGNPVQTALQGYLQGSQVGMLQQQRQQELAKQQAAAAAQAQMQTDFQSVAGNPNSTGSDYARLMTLYPQLSEGINRAWGALNETQKQTKLDQTGQIFSALQQGKPQIAKDYLQSIVEGATNSGDTRQAAMAQGLIKQIETDPQSALASTQMMLVSQLGPEKFAQAFGQVGAETRAQKLAPEEFKKTQAEATIKAEEAKIAPQKYAQELEKQGWDIQKLQEDIRASKEGTRLRAMEVAMQKELQPLKKQELQVKINEANQKIGDQLREKVSAAQGAAASIDNLSNTVDRILKNPSLDSVVGSIQGRAPAFLSDEAASAIALIDQLGSQAFIAQIPQMKGTGSLSEKEGDKLQASLQNLSRVQGEKQFRENLGEVQRLMTKARERLSKSTGIPLGGPDRPNAPQQGAEFGGGAAQPAQPGSQQQRNVVVDF